MINVCKDKMEGGGQKIAYKIPKDKNICFYLLGFLELPDNY